MSITYGLLSAFVAVFVLSFSLPSVASPGRSLHQHVERRATIDICATIGSSSLGSVPLNLPASNYEICIDICLCLSTLPVSIRTIDELGVLVETYGEDLVSQDLGILINSASNKQTCHYPEYSQPVCSPDNPCGFDCEQPWVAFGNKCICEYPYTLCNGVCGIFNQGCGSAVPYKRGINPDLKARSHGIVTYQDALATCCEGEDVCGVYHGSSAFECLDTNITLESCGGCVAPNPFLLKGEQGPEGVDCTALPHVRDVHCSAGSCIVERCDDGFVPSLNRRECVQEGFVVQPIRS